MFLPQTTQGTFQVIQIWYILRIELFLTKV